MHTTGRTIVWRALLIIVLHKIRNSFRFHDRYYSCIIFSGCQWRGVESFSRALYRTVPSPVYGRPQSMEGPFTCTLQCSFLSSVFFCRKRQAGQLHFNDH